MAHLLRIVMIHGHLEGVVELSVDGHTNICGTNASGKTTLQRLVPVFYGELPNKVVPKTRMKFDAFYLPHRNSYLVYEYRREAGNVCQAVLTRKSEGGVEYRFVGSPYRPEDYLVESDAGVAALDYAQWANGLRREGISVSAKLGATSEYRSVIQNDFTQFGASQPRGNSRDGLKLRQIAAQFSLVKPERRIRHIEKLVSAVHAKEGKMDTLKTMLAAIFEEDGVELPVTRIRNTKAREWIAQMRQSMRLEPLQQALGRLGEVDREIADLETTLWQLRPQLEADRHRGERTLADLASQLNRHQCEFQARERDYEQARDALNDRTSELSSELDHTQRDLNDLQRQYEQYAEADMPALERDLESLPQWREQHQQLRDHLEFMQQAVQASQAKLEGRLRELADTLARQTDEAQALIDALGDEKEARRERHWEAQRTLEARYQAERSDLDASYQARLEQGIERLAELKAQQTHTQTPEEVQEAELAQARLDQAQSDRSAAATTLEGLRREHETWKGERDAAERELEQARQQRSRAEHRCAALYQQRDPAQGSLRHFLRYHRPGWEQTLGKVIAPELLERRDLAPQVKDTPSDDLFGVALDLAAIALPDYAQDEAGLLAAIEAAEVALTRAEADVQAAEKRLRAHHERVQGAETTLGQARIALKRADTEVEYALEARRQQQERHARQQQARRADGEAALAEQEALQQALRDEKREALEALADTHQAQLLELKADAQSQLDSLDEQIRQHKRQLGDLKAEHRRQREELEAAFNQELEAQGVDPVTLKETKSRLAALEERMRLTAARQEELAAYRRFMRVEWGERKPRLVEKEATLTRERQAAEREREQLRGDFQAAKSAHQQAVSELKAKRHAEQEVMDALAPLLTQVESLALSPAAEPLSEAPGDVHERIERARQALIGRSRELETLRKGCEQVEGELIKGASSGFVDALEAERGKLTGDSPRRLLPLLRGMLQLLEDQQLQLVQQGRNLSDDLDKFFTVFRDLNRRISAQSRRLSEEVADDLKLEGIGKAEVKIQSTIDELGFWEPLKLFAQRYREWRESGQPLPSDDYLDALADVVELLRSDQQYSFESLLRLELHLNEGGTDLVIKNDRQLLESSSHGMAYLILCKFLLAFTRLLRGQAQIAIHWPIDEIGTLAYHNVEKLFDACDSNRIHIVGAFPNPESDVLLLFHNRYLIDRDEADPNCRRLKRIEPRLSRLAERLQARSAEEVSA
ncbi:ATP-binding protein [Halomonas campisalis]|uniref:ATP-binding protein n=1 Tax=Billgrantia campisalis TaxID=74661 RepID=A0ABS9P7Y1_9GAMM|nr:ATP-binding protein [Halomonas campisalis]MCG6657867.1 ATP-binding protein [Halomonas campisalis]MDR5863609.1 ATP-binding protein [Halomonas campisalis]